MYSVVCLLCSCREQIKTAIFWTTASDKYLYICKRLLPSYLNFSPQFFSYSISNILESLLFPTQCFKTGSITLAVRDGQVYSVFRIKIFFFSLLQLSSWSSNLFPLFCCSAESGARTTVPEPRASMENLQPSINPFPLLKILLYFLKKHFAGFIYGILQVAPIQLIINSIHLWSTYIMIIVVCLNILPACSNITIIPLDLHHSFAPLMI